MTLSRLLSLEGAGDGLPITLDHAGRELGDRPLPLRATHPAHADHGSGTSRVLRLSHALLIEQRSPPVRTCVSP